MKGLTRKQEQRGTRRLMQWGVVAAAIIAIGLALGFLVVWLLTGPMTLR